MLRITLNSSLVWCSLDFLVSGDLALWLQPWASFQNALHPVWVADSMPFAKCRANATPGLRTRWVAELGQRLNGNGLCLPVRSQKLRLGRQEVRNQSYAATWNLESPEPETEPRWHLQHLSCRDRLVVASMWPCSALMDLTISGMLATSIPDVQILRIEIVYDSGIFDIIWLCDWIWHHGHVHSDVQHGRAVQSPQEANSDLTMRAKGEGAPDIEIALWLCVARCEPGFMVAMVSNQWQSLVSYLKIRGQGYHGPIVRYQQLQGTEIDNRTWIVVNREEPYILGGFPTKMTWFRWNVGYHSPLLTFINH